MSINSINRLNTLIFILLFFQCHILSHVEATVKVGVETLFTPNYQEVVRGKKIGLITNHTAIDSQGRSTIDILKQNAVHSNYSIAALFAPEHGISGLQYNGAKVEDSFDPDGIPIFSLHGSTRRPTPAMLEKVNLLVYDIQDIGSRAYTYISTLFYVMEEAAKAHIPVVVLDRPNPLGGLLVDGPMLEEKWRSFVGYINVPYCHGLTIGELAQYFNVEYKIGCDLVIIPMQGWRRNMIFRDTGLIWIPPSPQVPEPQTAFYFPSTGFLGELKMVSIGINYTLPFKVVAAPWINAQKLSQALNGQNYPGVRFQPFHFTPFFGCFSGQACHGVLIVITEPNRYLPVTTQFLIMGILKTLYPTQFLQGLDKSNQGREMFNKVNGTAEVYRILKEEQYVIWKLRGVHQKERAQYMHKRQSYMMPDY